MAFDPESPLGQVQEFLAVQKKRRWQVILPALFIVSVGVVYAVIVPKKFPVRTQVEIRPARIEADYQLRNPQETSTATELQNAEWHIKHFGRVKRILEEQGQLWDEYVKLDPIERPEYVQKVLDNIRVVRQAKLKEVGSTFVEITYSDINPDRAEAFLRRLTEVWIQEVVERDRRALQEERDVLQNRVLESQKEFRAVNKQYHDLAKGMGIDPSVRLDLERNKDAEFARIDGMKDQMVGIQAELTEAEAELGLLREKLVAEPLEVARKIALAGINFNSQIVEAERKIFQLRTEQRRITPQHSRYRKIESDIAEQETQIEQLKALEQEGRSDIRMEPNPRRVSLIDQMDEKELEIGTIRARLAATGERIREKQKQIHQRTDDYEDLVALAEQRDRAREEWLQSAGDLGRKKRALEIMTEAWEDPFEIVRPPFAPPKATEPNPWLIIAFVAVAGVALGLLVALLLEYGNNAYRNVQELSQVMTAPVLGAINRIVTSAETRRGHLRRMMVGTSSFVIIGGLLWFTWIWSTSPEKLPVEVQKAVEDFRLLLM